MTQFHVRSDQFTLSIYRDFAQTFHSDLVFDIFADPVIDNPIGQIIAQVIAQAVIAPGMCQ
jgi:hypothetical protein